MFERTLEVLSSLPSSSTTDLEIKKQCEARLMLARRALALTPAISEDARMIDLRKGLLPWEAAEKMLMVGISTKHSSVSSVIFVCNLNSFLVDLVHSLCQQGQIIIHIQMELRFNSLSV